jgi:V/A-type H+-transporting ATPase subunit F
MMKIAAFCSRDTATGFRLAGVKDIFISEGNEKEIWNRIIERNDIGILLINEQISQNLDRYIRDYQMANNIPIIIEIPNKKGRIEDHVDFVTYLIKKAVGVEVNK